ncbi:hypothetical protein SAMN05192583_1686 [Sphingomonas gellani]|uniref:Uncharacterized protein n=1 Tax=Sphingomonas gellani TaxID=1166340 RepID=A0A1H8CPW2_9SPHN|nr:hypothetical protein SAMN05192583_1686 [Sphingomonas gellani]
MERAMNAAFTDTLQAIFNGPGYLPEYCSKGRQPEQRFAS